MKTSKFHKCFVVFRLTSFSRNLRTELKKAQKIYFAERLKFSHYNRRPANMYFWRTRTQKEIDYVEEYDGQIAGYEFKWGQPNPSRCLKIFWQPIRVARSSALTGVIIGGFCYRQSRKVQKAG